MSDLLDGAQRSGNFELNDAQYEFVYDDRHKFAAYIGGIGAGKSFAGGLKGMVYALKHPGSLGMIGAPNYPQLRDSTMRAFFDHVLVWDYVANWAKGDGILSFKNGSEILFRSMDKPDSRRGPNLAWFWLDEGPLCGYYAWQIMKGRLRDKRFPVQAWITGTPHGQDEFYEDFENYDGTDQPRPGHVLYRASTRDNQHNLTPGFVEDMGYEGKFAQQEIEGLFVRFEGLVYDFLPEWHLGEWTEKDKRTGHARPPALRIGGVDWGYTNPAVALPVYVDGDDRCYVLDEFYRSREGFTGEGAEVGAGGISKAILDFTREYGIETWYCGPDEPGHIEALNAMFRRKELMSRAVAANDDIIEGVATVRRQMAQRGDDTTGLYLSARCAQTRAEFRTYSYPGKPRGQQRDPAEKPIKKIDHAMDALRYCLHSTLPGRGRATHVTSAWYEGMETQDASDIRGIKLLRKVF